MILISIKLTKMCLYDIVCHSRGAAPVDPAPTSRPPSRCLLQRVSHSAKNRLLPQDRYEDIECFFADFDASLYGRDQFARAIRPVLCVVPDAVESVTPYQSLRVRLPCDTVEVQLHDVYQVIEIFPEDC